MEVGQFGFELDVIVGVAADVAGAARTGADIMQRLFHRGDDLGVLAHGEIVVRAPHGDVLRAIVTGKAARIRVGPLVAQNVDKYAVTPFGMQAVDRGIEYLVVVHGAIILQEALSGACYLHGI